MNMFYIFINLNDFNQVGTVIEPATDFFNRLSKKERKATFADELLSDQTRKNYRWDRFLFFIPGNVSF